MDNFYNHIIHKFPRQQENNKHRTIEWNKVDCCENCGADDFYTATLNFSGRKIRLCNKCMVELVEGIVHALKK